MAQAWEERRADLLNELRDLHRRGLRAYTLVRPGLNQSFAGYLYVHDGNRTRSDVELGVGDFDYLVSAGFLRDHLTRRNSHAGSLAETIETWDAPRPATPAGPSTGTIMHWDDEQKTLLRAIADAYKAKRRDYTSTRTRAGEELILTDGKDGRTDIAINAADYELFVEAGFLRQRTATFGGCTGSVSPSILGWDAPPPVPPQPISVSGHGNALLIQQGTGHTASNVTLTTNVSIGEAKRLRDELAALLAKSQDASAKDVLDQVDDAIDAAAKGRRSTTTTLLKESIERAAKLGAVASGSVAVIRLIASACGVPLP